MSLKEQLQSELKKALKSKNKIRLETIRSIINAIKNQEINSKKDIDDEGIYKILSSLSKQRKDSIEQFKKGNRNDLAEKEEQELKILLEFLPAQLSEEEIRDIVKTTIEELGNITIKDIGKVMKSVMPKLRNRADGKLVNKIVKDILS